MSRTITVLSVAALVAVLALGMATEPALAASPLAKNLGGEVKDWATYLVIAVAGLVGIPALFKRDVGQAVTILVVVIIVGGFAYSPGQVKHVINGMWSSLSQGMK